MFGFGYNFYGGILFRRRRLRLLLLLLTRGSISFLLFLLLLFLFLRGLRGRKRLVLWQLTHC
jgi:hypothetical protein